MLIASPNAASGFHADLGECRSIHGSCVVKSAIRNWKEYVTKWLLISSHLLASLIFSKAYALTNVAASRYKLCSPALLEIEIAQSRWWLWNSLMSVCKLTLLDKTRQFLEKSSSKMQPSLTMARSNR